MKIYHTVTQEDYDALMVELEAEGYKWVDGEIPPELSLFDKYGSESTVTTYNGISKKFMQYSKVAYQIENSPNEPIIEYKAKAKGDDEVTKKCEKCDIEYHGKKANYCSICGKKLVEEPEFKSGDIVASQVLSDGGFSFVRLNEDLTNRLNYVDGFWYFKRDCEVNEVSLGVFKEDTRHATPEEITEYESALQFHEHGRDPFEVKKGDLIKTPSKEITLILYPENYTKEEFLDYGWEFLKTVEEVNEWLGTDDE